MRPLLSNNLELTQHGASATERFDESYLGTVGALVTDRIAEAGCGDRHRGLQGILDQMASAAGIKGWKRRKKDRREGFERLAPVAALIDDLESWTAAQRRALGNALTLKGAPQEIEYATAMFRHERFRQSLIRACSAHA